MKNAIPIIRAVKRKLKQPKRLATVNIPLPSFSMPTSKPSKGFQDIKRKIDLQNRPSIQQYKYIPYKELKKMPQYRRKISYMA